MELKPCPFCGSEAKIFGRHAVCTNDKCNHQYDTFKIYPPVWNTRPIEDKLAERVNLYPELVEALKEAGLYHQGHYSEIGNKIREVLKKCKV